MPVTGRTLHNWTLLSILVFIPSAVSCIIAAVDVYAISEYYSGGIVVWRVGFFGRCRSVDGETTCYYLTSDFVDMCTSGQVFGWCGAILMWLQCLLSVFLVAFCVRKRFFAAKLDFESGSATAATGHEATNADAATTVATTTTATATTSLLPAAPSTAALSSSSSSPLISIKPLEKALRVQLLLSVVIFIVSLIAFYGNLCSGMDFGTNGASWGPTVYSELCFAFAWAFFLVLLKSDGGCCGGGQHGSKFRMALVGAEVAAQYSPLAPLHDTTTATTVTTATTSVNDRDHHQSQSQPQHDPHRQREYVLDTIAQRQRQVQLQNMVHDLNHIQEEEHQLKLRREESVTSSSNSRGTSDVTIDRTQQHEREEEEEGEHQQQQQRRVIRQQQLPVDSAISSVVSVSHGGAARQHEEERAEVGEDGETGEGASASATSNAAPVPYHPPTQEYDPVYKML